MSNTLIRERILHVLFLDKYWDLSLVAKLLNNVTIVVEGLCEALGESDVAVLRDVYSVVVPVKGGVKDELLSNAVREFQAKGVSFNVRQGTVQTWRFNGGKAGFLTGPGTRGSTPSVLLLNDRPISRRDANEIPAIVNTIVEEDYHLAVKRAGLFRRRYGFSLVSREHIGELLNGIRECSKQVEFEKDCRYRNNYYILDQDIFSLTDLIRYMECKCLREQLLVA